MKQNPKQNKVSSTCFNKKLLTRHSEDSDIFSEKPVRIFLGAVVAVGGIFLLGKTLKIVGTAVEDARYFVKAIKGKS